MANLNGLQETHAAGSGDSRLFSRFSVGNLSCVALCDGYIPTPPFILAPEVDVGELEAFLADNGEHLGSLMTPITCLYVETADGKHILIDSGMGTARGHSGPNIATVGKLKEAMKQAAIDPEAIEIVLVSHIHPDHIGGLFDDTGIANFPNARYYVPREDAAFWSGEHPDLNGTLMPPPARPGVIHTATQFLQRAAPKTTLFGAGEKVLDGIFSKHLPGHTPGQVGYIVEGGAETLFFSADAAGHFAISLKRPQWRFSFDTDSPLAIKTRKEMLGFLADRGWTTYTPHFPFPGVGKIVRKDGALEWLPERA